MLVNGLLSVYILVRWGWKCFNFTYTVLPHSALVMLNCAILPGFYFLEGIAMMLYCSEDDMEYCKFGIHHLLTVMLFFVVIHFELYSGPAMGIQAAHGLMNFWSYHHLLTMYLFCNWYIIFTILCSIHLCYHCIFTHLPGVPKSILWVQLLFLAIVGVNNLFSSDLVSTCIRPNDSHTFLSETYLYLFHILMTTAIGGAYLKFTLDSCRYKEKF